MTQPVTVTVLIEYAWNYLLPRAQLDEAAYRVLYWLHVASAEDLNAEQIAAFLAALVEAGAI